MSHESRTDIGTPTPEELRSEIEHARDEAGRSTGPLAAGADTRTRTTAVKQQVAEKAAPVTDQIRERTQQAARLAKDITPDPVLEKTARAATKVRGSVTRAGRYAAARTPDPLLQKAGQAAGFARANRPLVLAGGSLLVGSLLVRRARGGSR